MQDGLQEIKELITREVGSLKSEVTSVCKRLDALEEGQIGLREEIEAVLGYRYEDEALHIDNIALI